MKPVIRIIAFCLTVNLFYIYPATANAQVPVSASVPEQSFTAPILILPAAGGTINTSRPTFSWSRPSPLPTSPLNHYDLYIDGVVFAASISDSLSSQDFYFYTATASSGTFYVTLKTDLTQGYHTWNVTAYSDAGSSQTATTRTFYLDSIFPFISVTKVDKKTLTWNTSVPSSLPSVAQSYLTSTTQNPLLYGGVETSSNIQITLVCPQNIPTCTNQSYTTNSTTGLWQTQFYALLANKTYTVKIVATDAAANITTFPDFFITYGVAIVTPTATLKPTATATVFPTLTPLPPLSPTASPSAVPSASPSAFPGLPLPSTTITPPPNELNLITPTEYISQPPAIPTPPPQKALVKPRTTVDIFYNFILILMLFGLPLHLLMTIIGTSTPIQFVPKFLLILAFPFMRKRKYQTVPFCFIDIFISDKLDHPWQSVISDIKGYYNLKSPIPANLFISLSAFGRTWKDNLFKGSIIPLSCLYPLPMTPLDDRKKLLKTVYDMRIIPLILALITSCLELLIEPSYLVIIYFYLSLQYLFSEYLYSKI